jgi:hypothetical protein
MAIIGRRNSSIRLSSEALSLRKGPGSESSMIQSKPVDRCWITATQGSMRDLSIPLGGSSTTPQGAGPLNTHARPQIPGTRRRNRYRRIIRAMLSRAPMRLSVHSEIASSQLPRSMPRDQRARLALRAALKSKCTLCRALSIFSLLLNPHPTLRFQ